MDLVLDGCDILSPLHRFLSWERAVILDADVCVHFRRFVGFLGCAQPFLHRTTEAFLELFDFRESLRLFLEQPL